MMDVSVLKIKGGTKCVYQKDTMEFEIIALKFQGRVVMISKCG